MRRNLTQLWAWNIPTSFMPPCCLFFYCIMFNPYYKHEKRRRSGSGCIYYLSYLLRSTGAHAIFKHFKTIKKQTGMIQYQLIILIHWLIWLLVCLLSALTAFSVCIDCIFCLPCLHILPLCICCLPFLFVLPIFYVCLVCVFCQPCLDFLPVFYAVCVCPVCLIANELQTRLLLLLSLRWWVVGKSANFAGIPASQPASQGLYNIYTVYGGSLENQHNSIN